MFYRYEAKNKNGEYEGIFRFFNPSDRRYFNRFVKEPQWYKKNPNVNSRCWFTEEGYRKYHSIIDELISKNGIKDVRLLTQNTLDNVVCKGKIQCIEMNWKFYGDKHMEEKLKEYSRLLEKTFEWSCNDEAKAFYANAVYFVISGNKFFEKCEQEFLDYMHENEIH